MDHSSPAYGLWFLVIVNSAVFILFAFTFFKPQTRRDWRSFSAFSGFIVALFAEMYGFPLTIYLLSGWIQSRAPGTDIFGHEAGHLWQTIFGLKGDPHTSWLHALSFVFLIGGFWILSAAWPPLYRAQRQHRLATEGIYARLRHPQYAGFILIMLGFLIQWPTLLTLAMFPVLVVMYVRLAISEEKQAEKEFGQAWRDYATRTPRFIPKLGSTGQSPAAHGHT